MNASELLKEEFKIEDEELYRRQKSKVMFMRQQSMAMAAAVSDT